MTRTIATLTYWFLLATAAYAQAGGGTGGTGTGSGTGAGTGAGTSAGSATTGLAGMNWLWIIIAVIVIGGIIWYFTRGRRTGV